ncbi:hypothetical protein E8E11_005721 [Didymella keratinophila]|nr:hypothetical protein E8E11_005721 [Didymella keratinophila]
MPPSLPPPEQTIEHTPCTPFNHRSDLFDEEIGSNSLGEGQQLDTPRDLASPMISIPRPQIPTLGRVKLDWHGLLSPNTPSCQVVVNDEHSGGETSAALGDRSEQENEDIWTDKLTDRTTRPSFSPITPRYKSPPLSNSASELPDHSPRTPTPSSGGDEELALQLSSPSFTRRSNRLLAKVKTQAPEKSKPTPKVKASKPVINALSPRPHETDSLVLVQAEPIDSPFEVALRYPPGGIGPIPLTCEETHQGGLQDYVPGGRFHPEYGMLPILSSLSDGSDAEVYNFEGIGWTLPWAQIEGGLQVESAESLSSLAATDGPSTPGVSATPAVEIQSYYVEARDCPDDVTDLDDAWRWLKEWEFDSTTAFVASPGKTWLRSGIPLTTVKTKQPIASLMALTMSDETPGVEHWLVKQALVESLSKDACYTAEHWSNIAWDKKIDYPLLGLAVGLKALPTGVDAGPLTTLIKWCRDHGRTETMLSEVPNLLKEVEVEALIDPGSGTDTDQEVLGRYGDAIKNDRRRLIKERKQADMETEAAEAAKEKKSKKRRLE